jgi:hypothetical protein
MSLNKIEFHILNCKKCKGKLIDCRAPPRSLSTYTLLEGLSMFHHLISFPTLGWYQGCVSPCFLTSCSPPWSRRWTEDAICCQMFDPKESNEWGLPVYQHSTGHLCICHYLPGKFRSHFFSFSSPWKSISALQNLSVALPVQVCA